MSKRPLGEKLNAAGGFFLRTTPYLDCARVRLMGKQSKEYNADFVNLTFPQRLYFCNPSPHLFDVHVSGCAVGRGEEMQYRNTLMLFEETRIGGDEDFVLQRGPEFSSEDTHCFGAYFARLFFEACFFVGK